MSLQFQLYAVVQNVKQAHQCHESGETQEFNDDIEYLLDGLQQTNSVGTRCLRYHCASFYPFLKFIFLFVKFNSATYLVQHS